MKRLFTFLSLLSALPASAQFAQFNGDATYFLSGANTWVVPGTFGAISATTITASGAQTNASTLGVAGATTLASTVAVGGRATFNAGLTRTPTTLVPASGGTNYGLDMALWPAAFKAVTNHITFTGVTNNVLGASMLVVLVNTSGSDYTIRAPANTYTSSTAGTVDWPTVLTNGTAATIEVYGTGSNSTNSIWRFKRYN